MARRSDEVDPEAASVEDDIAERVDLGLAAIAAAGADLAQAQRAAEEAAQLTLQGLNVRCAFARDQQFGSLRGGEPPVRGKSDQIIGTCGSAIAAEDASAQVEARALERQLDRLARANVAASGAAISAFALIKHRSPAKERRKVRLFRRVGDRAMTLSGPRHQGFEHSTAASKGRVRSRTG